MSTIATADVEKPMFSPLKEGFMPAPHRWSIHWGHAPMIGVVPSDAERDAAFAMSRKSALAPGDGERVQTVYDVVDRAGAREVVAITRIAGKDDTLWPAICDDAARRRALGWVDATLVQADV